jgi:LTXXQ motif family protein
MSRALYWCLTIAVLAFGPVAYGQEGKNDLQQLTNVRVGLVKAALQLTPDQEKYWSALEEAIRARSAGRQQRLAAWERLRDQKDIQPFEVLRQRADSLVQRGTQLKQLVDAWQPLSQTLSPEQKERMNILLRSGVLRVMERVQARRMEMKEEDDDE